jgi:hypothetical protein
MGIFFGMTIDIGTTSESLLLAVLGAALPAPGRNVPCGLAPMDSPAPEHATSNELMTAN